MQALSWSRTLVAHSQDTSLFDCTQDVFGFVMACCCPCVEGSYQRSAVEDRDCTPLDFVWMFCCLFVFYSFKEICVLLTCRPCCMIKVRGDIRDKYGIAGSCLVDALLVLCCYCLPVSQHTRQLEMRGSTPAGMNLPTTVFFAQT